MGKKIAIGIALLLVAFLGFAAMQPDTFELKRSLSMAAPADKVFANINDFHKWEAWSPWAKIDPAMKATYTGTASGVGAVYDWTGNDEVGTGKMTITGSEAPGKIVIKPDFIAPFEAHNTTTFLIAKDGDKTKVDWIMTGNNNFMGKIIHVFMDMDKMVGPDFEKGLAQMKGVVEKG